MPIENCKISYDVKIWHPKLVNLYGCTIEAGTRIGAFVEIGKGAKIGEGCKIEAHAFISKGTVIGNRCFIGPGAIFCNMKHPMKGESYQSTFVEDDVVIGAGAVILPGLKIGRESTVGAGAVVTKDVPAGKTVFGNPAKTKRDYADDCKYLRSKEPSPWCGCQGEKFACKCEDYEPR